MREDIFNRAFYRPEDKTLLDTSVLLSTTFTTLEDVLPYIALRVNTLSTVENIDSFSISTSAHPEDILTYTSPVDKVNLQIRDGGFF